MECLALKPNFSGMSIFFWLISRLFEFELGLNDVFKNLVIESKSEMGRKLTCKWHSGLGMGEKTEVYQVLEKYKTLTIIFVS